MVLKLIDTSLLKRNSIMNMIGQLLPMMAALVAIPILIRSLGTERFGVLSLAWVLIGYFNLFDFGLGRALTKLIADRMGTSETDEIPGIIWTAIILMLSFGILGSVCMILVTPVLVGSILNIPLGLQSETIQAFYVLSFSIPIVIVSVGLIGILEAHQKFNHINMVRVPMGFLIFLGPLTVIPYSQNLVALVVVLAVTRLSACVAYAILSIRVVPALKDRVYVMKDIIWTLLNFGGWLTVSNIVGPFMLYADRFFIASIISISAVAYYTTPFDIVTRLLIIPSAILGVMFPVFANRLTHNPSQARQALFQTIKYLSFIMIPIVIAVAMLSRIGIRIWLNDEFSENSYRVAQILALAVYVNGLGLVFQGFIQASGHPDITAKLHLIEFPLYFSYLMFLLPRYGIIGAASAWLIRVLISAVVLGFIANHLSKQRLLENIESKKYQCSVLATKSIHVKEDK